MNDIKIDRNQLWTTTIFTVRNPLHGQIVEALKSHIYAHMQATGAGIYSGVSTDIKTNLFHSGTLYRGSKDRILASFNARILQAGDGQQ